VNRKVGKQYSFEPDTYKKNKISSHATSALVTMSVYWNGRGLR